MDGERTLGETPRVGTLEALRVFVHQRMVYHDVHQGVGLDLVSSPQVHVRGVG